MTLLSRRALRWHQAVLVCAIFALPYHPAVADNDPIVGDVMQRVLAGDLDAARTALDQLRADSDDPRLDQLRVELGDLGRGGYATENNRSFPELAPLWEQARAQWLKAQSPPNGTLPNAVVALPDTVRRLLLVDTRHSAAWLLERDDAGHWPAVSGFYISIGANGPGKQRRGDRRTPIGVYYAIDKLDTARLPRRYGSQVLPLDYPNVLDVQQGKTGDGIWLHGIDADNNIRPPRDTDGCIAFDNSRIEALAEIMTLHTTPVVVADGFDWQPDVDLEVTTDALRQALDSWRVAQRDGNSGQLFSMYADDYTRHGLSSQLWRAGQVARLKADLLADIVIENLEMFEADDGVFMTRFRQVLERENKAPVTTMRRLYWRRIEGQWKVIAEQNG